jgi:hypothetical protein
VTVGPNRPIGLEPVDRAEVTIVVDNFVDLLSTGWKAVHQLARALPDSFVQPAVGTVVTF